jgi:hypothetical protein
MIFLLAAVFGLAPVGAQPQGAKTLKSNGRVIAISSDSMTIRPGMETMVFIIDKATKVTGKGVGTKTRALTAAGKPVVITELVEEFDSVTVKYHDMDGKLHAREVDINVKRRPQ